MPDNVRRGRPQGQCHREQTAAALVRAMRLPRDADGRARLAAFHWTKVDQLPVGEVYVVGVDPERQGEGLGRVATLVGLHHLADRGVETVELYVDGDNRAAVTTYGRLGFERAAVDVQYGPPV